MMKKTIIASMVLATSLLATPVMAESNFGVDLESMSTEDLVALKDEINAELGNRGGDNVLPQGVYIVGTDIKAANFKATVVHGDSSEMVGFTIYASEDDYKSDTRQEYFNISYDSYKGVTESMVLNLKEGQVLVVEYGSAALEESKPSWAPDSEE